MNDFTINKNTKNTFSKSVILIEELMYDLNRMTKRERVWCFLVLIVVISSLGVHAALRYVHAFLFILLSKWALMKLYHSQDCLFDWAE